MRAAAAALTAAAAAAAAVTHVLQLEPLSSALSPPLLACRRLPQPAAGLPGATIGESLVENAFRSQLDLRPELVLNGPPTDVSTKTEAYRQKARKALQQEQNRRVSRRPAPLSRPARARRGL